MQCEKCNMEYEGEKCPNCNKPKNKKIKVIIAAIVAVIAIVLLILGIYNGLLKDKDNLISKDDTSSVVSITDLEEQTDSKEDKADSKADSKEPEVSNAVTSDNTTTSASDNKSTDNQKTTQGSKSIDTETAPKQSGTALNSVPEKSSDKRITLDEYKALKQGMSYEEAVKVIGGEGELLSEAGSPGEEYYTAIYLWYGEDFADNDGAVVTITFQDGKLLSSVQTGLE